jgi:uncharacterized protein (TIGR00369 family)
MSADEGASHVRRWVLGEEHLQGAGVVQGGVLAGILAATMRELASSLAGSSARVCDEVLETTFVRPASPGEHVATARLVRRGRTVIQAEAEIVDAAGRSVANARSIFRLEPGTA